MALNLKVFYLVAIFVYGNASPLPYVGDDEFESSAFVDCNDELLVQKMQTANIRFSCLQESDNSILESIMEKPIPTSFYSSNDGLNQFSVLEMDPHNRDKVTLVLDTLKEELEDAEDECDEDPEKCASRFEEADSKYDTIFYEPIVTRCPQGSVFVSEIGKCLSPDLSPVDYSESESYFNPNSDSLNARFCNEGYVYDLRKGSCIPDKKMLSVSGGPSVQAKAECEGDAILDPQSNQCIPLVYDADLNPETRAWEGITISPHRPGVTRCPSGYVENPSSNTCGKIITKPRGTTPKPQRLAQIKKPSVFSNEDKSEEKCEERFIFNYEVKLCLPFEGGASKPQKDQGTRITKPYVKLTAISDSKPTIAVTRKPKCGPGFFYLSELDYCDPIQIHKDMHTDRQSH